MNSVEKIKQKKLRPTNARVAILNILAHAKKPLTVQEIIEHQSIAPLSLDPVTVYRTIESFYIRSLIRRIELGEGKYRYEIKTDTNHHHHVVCTSCHMIVDVSDCIGIREINSIEKSTGFQINDHALEFFGLCIKCKSIEKNY